MPKCCNVKKNEINDALGNFLDCDDVNSYLTFKISAWKRGCTMSFELQTPQTSSTPVLPRKIKIATYQNTPYNF